MLFFDFNKWIKCNNVVVHCKTLEETIDFINVLKENNWKDKIKYASEYSRYIEYWNVHKENTCYNLSNGCFANYSYYSFYKEYIILEWSDYMFTTPKAILQEHDIVITRKYEGYMYYANQNIFVNSKGYNLVNDYNDDLIMTPEDDEDEDDICEFDIMQILRPKNAYEFVENNWGDAEVVWKRPEVVEMTLEEICEALGKNVKIIKSKK